MFKHCLRLVPQLVLFAFASVSADGSDWPMYRYDAARSGATPHKLPVDLHLRWTRQLSPPRPAWPESQYKLQFDAGYEPVCADGKLLIGSNVDGSVAAFDVDNGKLLWHFFTDGPVRFAPAINGGRVYVVSDDGCLYCLHLETGEQAWVVRGGPSRRQVIGNGQLASMWPARGGVVVHEGVAYFSAGIWPSMGIFIRAVDAVTGEVLWNNSTTGSVFVTHPHGAESFGSISPQGYLAISGDNLLVPGGRTLPGLFDLATGELRHFNFGGKGEGGYRVIAAGDYYFVRGNMLRIADGNDVGGITAEVVGPNGILSGDGSGIVVTSITGEVKERTAKDRRGREKTTASFQPDRVDKFSVDGPTHLLLQADSRVFAADGGRIAAYEPEPGRESLDPVWSADVDGDVWSMIAAGEQLFVTTKQGRLYCFGSKPISGGGPSKVRHIEPQRRSFHEIAGQVSDERQQRLSEQLVEMAHESQGFAVSIGMPNFGTLHHLLEQSELTVVAVDEDEAAVRAFRDLAAQDNRFGVRVSALTADVGKNELPAYFATIVFCEESRDWSQSQIESVFEILRPYGGMCCLLTDDSQHNAIVERVGAADLYGAQIDRQGEWTLLRRTGSLEDAGVWTHQYGDASSSVVSQDARVKAPLGLLWFGGPANDRVLPRHGHGPSPQVAGGRLFIEGPDMLRCVDVYTGRVWWEREFTGLGAFYDNTSHQAGAGEIGSNYVSLEDHVYLIFGAKLLELDAETGQTTREFQWPSEYENQPSWGALRVEGDVLIATASPVVVSESPGSTQSNGTLNDALQPTRYSSASRTLMAFDRHSGEVLWSRDAEQNFRHNTICAADERVYCIDALSVAKLASLKRRGVEPDGEPRLLALDAQTGEEIWSTTDDVFGTFLNYSREHDVLLQAGSAYRDRAKDEVGTGLVAYRGSTGDVIWQDRTMEYGGPCLLHGDRIITNGGGGFGLELLTGRKTGWTYSRMYGCNTAVGSRHLLTFRSGTAGYCDLAGDSGTGNFGGFRSSCTSNLIVADGVLNAPDYTRTCTCAYQIQTSLALVHMPDVESWTFGNEGYLAGPVQSLGINLGAPGDRRDAEGVLWFDYPIVGGPSPKLRLETEPKSPETFLRHSSLMQPGPQNWIGASGFRGLRRLRLQAKVDADTVTVRLVFSEPDGLPSGKRQFSVSINGNVVLPNLDVASEANGPLGTVTREFLDVAFDGTLDIKLVPAADSAPPILSGIAIMAPSTLSEE